MNQRWCFLLAGVLVTVLLAAGGHSQPEDSPVTSLHYDNVLDFIAEGDTAILICDLTEKSCAESRSMLEGISRYIRDQLDDEVVINTPMGYLDTSLYDLPDEMLPLPRPERRAMPLLMYRDGAFYAQGFLQGGSPTSVLDFLYQHQGKDIPTLSSEEELKDFVEANQAAAHSSLIIFGGEAGDSAHRTLLSVVQDHPGIYAVAAIYDEALIASEFAKAEQPFEDNSVLVYCHFHLHHVDHQAPALTGMSTISRIDLTEWLHEYASRHVAEWNPYLMNIMARKFQFVILALAPYDDEDAMEKLYLAVNGAAESHTDVGFAFADSRTMGDGYIRDGATGDVFPVATVLWSNPKQMRFTMDEKLPFTAENLSNWVSGLKTQTAMPFVKGAKAVKHNEEDTFREVVFSTYDKLVVESPKRVLLVIYSSDENNCPKCDVVFDVVDSVAARLPSDIVVAKYDIRQNYSSMLGRFRMPEVRVYEKGLYSSFLAQPSEHIDDDLYEFATGPIKPYEAPKKRKRGRHHVRDEL